MELEEREFSREEWTRTIHGLPNLSLMQTWEYAEAKVATGPWKSFRAIVRDGEEIVAAVQGTMRPLPVAGGGLVWINRGPILMNDSVRFDSVLEAIAGWSERRGWYVRIAPPLSKGVLSEDGLTSVGFRRTQTGGWCSSAVDLNLTADDLRSRLEQKWRNQLNKAIRDGVTVDCSTSKEVFDGYVGEYSETVKRKGFETTVTRDFLVALEAALPEDRKLIVFVASHQRQALGSGLIAVYGHTAEYLAGSISDKGRQLNAGNALLWAAMIEMQRRGFRRFDVGGMHPERTPKGIYAFKASLRGTPYCLENEIETTRRDWRSAFIRWRIHASRQI